MQKCIWTPFRTREQHFRPLIQTRDLKTEQNKKYLFNYIKWDKMSALWLGALLWMPVCVFHAGAGLPAEECVAPVHVFRLVVNGGYVKIRARFFKRLERAELFPVIPAEEKKNSVFKNNTLSLFYKIRTQSCAVKRLARDEIKQRRSDKALTRSLSYSWDAVLRSLKPQGSLS